MFRRIISLEFILRFFVVSQIFFFCFPFIRVNLFGGRPMHGPFESIVTVLPELLVGGLFVLSTIYVLTNRNSLFRWFWFDYLVGFFFVFNVVYGFVLSDWDYQSLLSFRMTYLPVLFYYVGRFFWEQKRGLIFQSLNTLFYSYIGLAIAGLILYFVFPDYQNRLILATGNLVGEYFIVRMVSLVLTPILFALLLVFSCFYFYDKIMKVNDWKNYLIFWLLWLCLALSVSRGATLAFFISFIFMSFVYKKPKMTLVTMGGMAVILIAVSFYATGSFEFIKWICYSAADTMNMEKDVTRVNRWLVTYNDFLAQPYGYGFGKTGAVAFRYYLNHPEVKAAVYSTDGWYLKTACETGMAGLLSYLILAASYFFMMVKKVFSSADTLLLVPFGIFMMVNIQSVVSNTLDFYPYTLLYWLLIGFSINALRSKYAG